MKLSVVIVNYNVKHYLEQCLHSVMRASEGIEMECLVVDNASTDESVAYLQQRFPQVTFIENKDNVGFAKANNQAISQSSGEYILLLNPDTFIGEDVLREVVGFFDSHPDAGGVGVKMLNRDGSFALESRRGIPTPKVSFYKMSGLCSLFPKSKRFGRYYMQYLDKSQTSQIEIISGACMFVRREALEKSGLLDETFFMYGEDIDLSYRLLLAGYKNYYLPRRILHYKGESTKKHSLSYVNAFYNAMLIFFNKHFADYSRFLSIPIKTAIYSKAVVTYIVQQFKWLRDSQHSDLSYVQQKKLLIIGSATNLKSMEDVCKSNSMVICSVLAEGDVLTNGHEAVSGWQNFDYVVYDTQTYGYSTILRLMENANTGKPGLPSLGTFTPETGIILLDTIALK